MVRSHPLSPNMQPNTIKTITTVVIVLLVAGALYNVFGPLYKKPAEEVALSQIAQEVRKGEITKIIVDQSTITATLANGQEQKAYKENDAISLVEYGITPDKVQIDVKNPNKGSFWPLTSVFVPSIVEIPV